MVKVFFNFLSGLWETVTSSIFSVLDFPAVPVGLVTAVNYLFDYMKQGMRIINFFCPIDSIKPRLRLFIAVYTALHTYKIIMWVLRKIPMLGIK